MNCPLLVIFEKKSLVEFNANKRVWQQLRGVKIGINCCLFNRCAFFFLRPDIVYTIFWPKFSELCRFVVNANTRTLLEDFFGKLKTKVNGWLSVTFLLPRQECTLIVLWIHTVTMSSIVICNLGNNNANNNDTNNNNEEEETFPIPTIYRYVLLNSQYLKVF
jgi:hypothetical protein